MADQPETTLSDDELARDDPDLCEHGWSRLHPQSCPECETTDRHLPPTKSQLRDAVLWAYRRLSVDGGMTAQEQATTCQELANVLFGRATPAVDGWKERVRDQPQSTVEPLIPRGRLKTDRPRWLPCPFCGSRDVRKMPTPEPNEGGFVIECANRLCSVSTPIVFSIEEAADEKLADIWNRRSGARTHD